jgi:hypothetical protein
MYDGRAPAQAMRGEAGPPAHRRTPHSSVGLVVVLAVLVRAVVDVVRGAARVTRAVPARIVSRRVSLYERIR